MIKIKSFTFNPFMENSYVLYDETKECIIIDPGCYEAHEQQELKSFIEEQELKVVKLVNTHCHIDHVLGNAFVKDTYQVPLILHRIEEEVLRAVKVYAPQYGFAQYQETQADEFLEEGDTLSFGQSELEVLFVPGHAPGHIALVNKAQKICLSGDVLFQGSIGRTDLPGGDMDTLLQSIREKLFVLDEETTVYSGHGPTTTIGFEKKHNPFLQ